MENFKFILLSFLFITLCAFSCEEECETLDDVRTSFTVDLSSTESSYSVGDEILLTASFPAEATSDITANTYDLAGANFSLEFEVFEVQSENEPATTAREKIEVTSLGFQVAEDNTGIFKRNIFECRDECSFIISLKMLEAGCYGLRLGGASLVSTINCVVVVSTAQKSEVSNFEVVEDKGTTDISYGADPVLITPSNSFFFMVE